MTLGHIVIFINIWKIAGKNTQKIHDIIKAKHGSPRSYGHRELNPARGLAQLVSEFFPSPSSDETTALAKTLSVTLWESEVEDTAKLYQNPSPQILLDNKCTWF